MTIQPVRPDYDVIVLGGGPAGSTLASFVAMRGHRVLLLERHGGGQSVDLVDIGHAHLVEQPPRVGRYRLEVPALRFRVQRPEGKR